ncbi:MAG: hypothetical protein ABI661_02695 [Gammaproteobacteria bacterium]
MTFAGLIFIGLLFGLILGGSLVGFVVVRAGGPLKESLFGNDARKPAFGGPAPAPELTPEAEKRVRALQEELRVANKLLDQDRVEREERDKAAKAAADELAGFRTQLADRNSRIADSEAARRESAQQVDELLGRLGERTEQLAKVALELKDTRMELDVNESGSTVTSAQVNQLQRERDELAALVEQLRPGRVASRPFA